MSVPCRVVDRWSWPRLLRDQGPKSRDFLCAMLVLHIRLGDDSSTFVGVHRWASDARMAVNTLQKQKVLALATGWLVAERRRGKDHRSPTLRCTAPVHIDLSEEDEKYATALVARIGDIDHAVSAIGDTAKTAALDDAVSVLSDTANTQSLDEPVSVKGDTASSAPVAIRETDAVSLGHKKAPMLYQNSPEKAVCCITAVSVESCNPLAALEARPEVLEVLKRSSKRKTEGAVSQNRTGVARDPTMAVVQRDPVAGSKADRLDSAADMMRRLPNMPIINVALRFQLSSDEVLQLRKLQ